MGTARDYVVINHPGQSWASREARCAADSPDNHENNLISWYSNGISGHGISTHPSRDLISYQVMT